MIFLLNLYAGIAGGEVLEIMMAVRRQLSNSHQVVAFHCN